MLGALAITFLIVSIWVAQLRSDVNRNVPVIRHAAPTRGR
jgi:hypothetical protein